MRDFLKALANALHDAALHLPLYNERVHDGAEVADHRIFHDVDNPRFRIDFNLADMAAVRVCGDAGLANVIDIERARRIGR